MCQLIDSKQNEALWKEKTQPQHKQSHIKASCAGLLVIAHFFVHKEHECRQAKASSEGHCCAYYVEHLFWKGQVNFLKSLSRRF